MTASRDPRRWRYRIIDLLAARDEVRPLPDRRPARTRRLPGLELPRWPVGLDGASRPRRRPLARAARLRTPPDRHLDRRARGGRPVNLGPEIHGVCGKRIPAPPLESPRRLDRARIVILAMKEAALLIGAIAATLVTHEAGHAAAAAALRVPWHAVITRRGPGIIIGRDDLFLSRWQLAATAAGGPLANLALCAAAYRLGQPLLVLPGLELALVNLLPFPHSDGSRMLHPARTLARARAAA